ncbi:MAG: histidine phosphatase family protein [Anaerolineae bacterium]|nr:histidine phosphatase family protein [Anaerolineae bacterium]
MTHLYFIRHADSIDGLENGKYVDLGLSSEGITQAEKLRDRLGSSGEIKADIVLCSTERRARETATIIAPSLGQPIIFDESLVEWKGDDGSLSPEEFMRQWNQVPKAQKAYFRWMEGFENRLEFSLRVHLAVNRLVQSHQGKTIVIISHGAFIQMAFLYFFGYGEASVNWATPEIRRTSITHWYHAEVEDRWILERSNDVHHLR